MTRLLSLHGWSPQNDYAIIRRDIDQLRQTSEGLKRTTTYYLAYPQHLQKLLKPEALTLQAINLRNLTRSFANYIHAHTHFRQLKVNFIGNLEKLNHASPELNIAEVDTLIKQLDHRQPNERQIANDALLKMLMLSY